MIGDYVRIRQLELVELLQAVTPHSGGQGLGRSHFPGPFKGLLQEWKTACLVLRIARLVIEVPHQNASVLGKGTENVLHIAFKGRIQTQRVRPERIRRVAHPSRVVNARLRLRLYPVCGFGVPAVVEENEERAYPVTVAYSQKVVHTLLQALRVVGIYHAAQINP